jgi:cyanate permease
MTVGIASSAMGPLVLGASADFLGGFQPSLWLFAGLAVTVAANGLKPESARGGDQLIQEEALELRVAA